MHIGVKDNGPYVNIVLGPRQTPREMLGSVLCDTILVSQRIKRPAGMLSMQQASRFSKWDVVVNGRPDGAA